MSNKVSNEIMVSIWCTAYNHEKYIRQCLDGFVMQKTNFRFEIIIHDDASTDSTSVIIREYEQKYPNIIKPIYQQVNQYSQKNAKIMKTFFLPSARGKYTAICEGDDYWIDPFKLQKQVDFLEANSDYVLVYSNAKKVNQNSQSIIRNSLKGVSGDLTNFLFKKGNPIITATVCFSSKYLWEYEQGLENNTFKMKMGDLPLWIFLSKFGKFQYFKEKTTAYRVLQESASHSKNKDNIISFIENTRDILLYFNKLFNLKISTDLIYKRYYITIIRNMVSFSKKDFIDYYYEGIRKYPSLLINWKIIIFFLIRIILNKKC